VRPQGRTKGDNARGPAHLEIQACRHPELDMCIFGHVMGQAEIVRMEADHTDKKENKNFPHILGNSEGSGAKSYITYDLLLIYGENICAFPRLLY
jgi:hypothetical protein